MGDNVKEAVKQIRESRGFDLAVIRGYYGMEEGDLIYQLLDQAITGHLDKIKKNSSVPEGQPITGRNHG